MFKLTGKYLQFMQFRDI